MKLNFLSMLGTSKKKAGVVALFAASVLALGTTTASVANAATDGKLGELLKLDNGKASYSNDGGQTWNEGVAEGADLHYSLDEGKTWNDGLPPEGSGEKSLVTNGTPVTEGAVDSVMTKNENGVMSYSTDGGKNWSNTAPDGFNTTVNSDGSVSFGKK